MLVKLSNLCKKIFFLIFNLFALGNIPCRTSTYYITCTSCLLLNVIEVKPNKNTKMKCKKILASIAFVLHEFDSSFLTIGWRGRLN